MRTLILLRHAQALLPNSSGKDFNRKLSSVGEVDALLQAQRLYKAALQPDFILCSPATRTLQTAEIFCNALKMAYSHSHISPQPVTSLYHANATGYINEIRSKTPVSAQCVLIVGHNPSIEDCALFFAKDSNPLIQRLGYGFPTAGLAIIETEADFSAISSNNAYLKALYLPHEDEGISP